MTKLFQDPPPEISHSAHQAHKLRLVTTDDAAFKCDGCYEPGYGPRYTCDCGSRRFDLHTRCALAESWEATIEHPMFGNHIFKFRQQPLLPVERKICDACGEPAHGFVYHCSEIKKDGGRDLHPCCATLLERICKDGRALVLRPSKSRRCAICGQRHDDGKYWAYRLEGEDDIDVMYVACLKKMAYQVWETSYENKYHSGGAQNLHVGLTDVDGLLQICRNSRTSTSTSRGFEQFIRIAGSVASVVLAVIFANPAALISAIPKKY